MNQITKPRRVTTAEASEARSVVESLIAANNRHQHELRIALTLIGNKGVKELMGRSLFRFDVTNNVVRELEAKILLAAE